MTLDFIYRQRLFAKPIRLDFYGGFIFELILAGAIWAIVLDLGDLLDFVSGQPVVTVSPRTFQLLGLIGPYGIRIAMYIAIIRRNRAPQVLEWIVTLIGLGFSVVFFALGGFMLTWYAELHGYDRCPAVTFRNTAAVFVLHETSCPAKPPAP